MHPMRKMIVAIVAVKTRYARKGPLELGIGRIGGDAMLQFWGTYDEYVRSVDRRADGGWPISAIQLFL